MGGKNWTEKEITILKQKALEGLSAKEIKKFLKRRTESSIKPKLLKLGLKLREIRVLEWTEEEITILKQKALEGLSAKEIKKFLRGRSEVSIPIKLRMLGLNLRQIRAKKRRDRKGLNKDGETKLCTKCGETLSKDNFRFRDGLYITPCNPCNINARKEFNNARREKYRKDKSYKEKIKKVIKKSYVKRRDSVLAQKAEYREENKEEINLKLREARKAKPNHFKQMARESYARHAEKRVAEKREERRKNPEKVREISAKSREKIKNDPERKKKYDEMKKKYRAKNLDKINQREREYRNTSPQRKISVRLRNRINIVLRYNQDIEKKASTDELVGCSIEDLKDWLEEQFTEDMTWDAFMAGDIHIDHIRPCASFDLTKKSEQLECFNWSNLQPLWAIDNLRKGDRYDV